jgi:hypothetical protein
VRLRFQSDQSGRTFWVHFTSVFGSFLLIVVMRSALAFDQLFFISDYTSDGVVISRIHLHRTPLNCKDALSACAAQGMRLYQMTSPEAARALFAAASTKFAINSRAILWVDGLLPFGCQSVNNYYGPFDTEAFDCNYNLWSFCEEVKVERSLSN